MESDELKGRFRRNYPVGVGPPEALARFAAKTASTSGGLFLKPRRAYRARATKLAVNQRLLEQLVLLGSMYCTQRDAANVLGSSPRRFSQLLKESREVRDAWSRGQSLGRVALRRLMWQQAQVDPTQARFLAETWL